MERPLMTSVLIALAALMGAAGVALSALAAHSAAGSGLEAAAHMLLFHAASVLAGTALIERARLWRPALLVALFAWVAGSVLFSADIALRALAGSRLFAMAAPLGGTALIGAWIALFPAAVGALLRR
jgi:uncharacterized membrane protein YgdD (TMEM256/DUF423 family)